MAAGGGADAQIIVEVFLDGNEASVQQLIAQISNVLKAQGKVAGGAEAASKQGRKAYVNLGDAVSEVTRDVGHLETAMERFVHSVTAQLTKILQQFQKLDASTNAQAAAVKGLADNIRLENYRTALAEDRDRQAKNAAERSATSLKIVEMQKQEAAARDASRMEQILAKQTGQVEIVAAREASTARILAKQQMYNQIARIEKALAATVAGFAKTAVAAVSRTFSGLGSALSRFFAKHTSDMKALDKTMTSGLSSSLRSRENMMQSSFLRQEQILTRSAARQQAAIAGLRTTTQTGVIGAANRSLNIGAWIGGAALLMAVKSTFTIGSEFTRGMAVLQAQLDLTDQAMEDVRQTAIDLGNDISLPGVSALDAAEAIQLLSKQFAALGDQAVVAAQDASKGTLQLARAVGVGAEEAAQVVGSAVNVFGIAASEATAVADQITAAMKNAAGVSFGDFADSFKQAAAVFAQFQVPALGAAEALIQFDTALAVIARQGVVGSDAGTSLKQFFLQANRNVDATKDALLELTQRAGETGTAFYDLEGNARPLEQTLDILRRGLVGYTDQQRNSALQTIFGSDAIRVANALLNTSTEEYAKVVQAMREQGLAAEIAAAQNTGLKGALDALRSILETVQILIYEQVSPALGEFVLGIAELTNAILFGEGAWETLRVGLMGVAAGMAAVIAAKAAVEVIHALGKVASLALTPFGSLLLVAGLIGGALALLLDRSAPLRYAFERIWMEMQKVAEAIVQAIQPAFEWFGNFIDETLIPAIDDFASWLAIHLLDAFEAVERFIRDKAIPAFQAVATFILDTAVPAVLDFAGAVGETLVEAFGWALDKAKEFWAFIEPMVQPAIDGFKSFAAAVKAVFTDLDFTGLREGFGDFISGVLAAGGNIVSQVKTALTPVVKAVGDFFRDLFSAENMKRYAMGFLGFVEEVGRILGLIVSDPRLYKVIAAVAAAAAVVALAFIKGFILGIKENLGELWSLFWRTLWEGFLLAVNNIGVLLAGGLAATVLFRSLAGIRSAFTTMGVQAGHGFVAGFKTSIAGAGSFMSGLFQGGSQFGSLRKLSTEAQQLSNQFRILGSPQTVLVSQKAVDDAKGRLRSLRKGIDDATFAGMVMRDRINAAMSAISTGALGFGKAIQNGFKTAFTGFGRIGAQSMATMFFGNPAEISATSTKIGSTIGTNIRSGLKVIKTGFQDTMNELRAIARTQGMSLGRYIGGGMVAGLATAVAGFTMGQAAGQSGGIGSALMSIIGGGVTGLALSGGNPIFAGIGAAVAAGGVAFGKWQEGATKAKDATVAFTQQVGVLADALINDLKNGLDAGVDGVVDLREAFAGDNFRTAAINSLRPIGAALDQLGLTYDQVISAILAGPGAQNGPSSISLGLNKLASEFPDLFKGAPDQFATAQAQIISGLQSAQLEARLLGDDLVVAYDGGTEAAEQFGAAVEWHKENFGPKMTRGVVEAMLDAGASIDDVKAKLAEMELPSIDTSQWEAEMGAATTAVDATKTALDKAKTAAMEVFGGFNGTSFGISFDEAVVAADAAGDEIIAALGLDGQVGDSKLNLALEGVGTSIGETVLAGIEAGMDASEIKGSLNKLKQAMLDSLDANDPAYDAAVMTIEAAFAGAVKNLTPTISEVEAAAEAATFAEAVQTYMTEHPLVLKSKAEAVVAAEGELDQAQASGIEEWIVQAQKDLNKAVEDAEMTITIPTPDVAKTSGEFYPAGRAAMSGVAKGIQENKVLPEQAMAAAMRSVIATALRTIDAQSPSKVFMEIGGFVIEGFVEGIEDGTVDLVEAATSAIDQFVEATVTAAEGAMSTFQELGAGLYSAMIGPGASSIGSFDFAQAAGAGQDALANIASTLESSAQSIWNATAKLAEGKEALSVGEWDLIGEGSTSLSIGDVVGRANRDALIGAFASIADYGELMLEQGSTAEQVASTIQPMIDATIDYAASLGFSRDQLIALADELGMSDADIAAWVADWESAGAAAGAAGAQAMADAVAAAAAEAAAELAKTISDAMESTIAGIDFDWTVGDIQTIGENAGLTGPALDEFVNKTVAQINELFTMSEDQLMALGRTFGLFGDALDEWVQEVVEWQTPEDEGMVAAIADAFKNAMASGDFMMDDKDIQTLGETLSLTGEALTGFVSQMDAAQVQLSTASAAELDGIGRSFGLFGEALQEWIEEVLKWQTPEDEDLISTVADAFKAAVKSGDFMMDDKDVQTMGEAIGLTGDALTSFVGQIDDIQDQLFSATESELDAIGRSFGLYGDALQAWIDEILKWQGQQDPTGAPTTLPGNPPVEQTNYFELYLPYGDPDAIALSIVNQMAVSAGVG